MQWEWVLEGLWYSLPLLTGFIKYITKQQKGIKMPKATVSIDTERFELTTLPAEGGEEGGWVELKTMSYGAFLKRKDMITKMSVKGQGKSAETLLEMANEKLTHYEFRECIVDHNLEDDGGNKLDFSKPTAIQRLNPRVGEEISTYIDKLNKFDEQDGEDPLDGSTTT
jgi:hypothetical protein